jgi:hypothetical protein
MLLLLFVSSSFSRNTMDALFPLKEADTKRRRRSIHGVPTKGS